jgi:hypothetical protein
MRVLLALCNPSPIVWAHLCYAGVGLIMGFGAGVGFGPSGFPFGVGAGVGVGVGVGWGEVFMSSRMKLLQHPLSLLWRCFDARALSKAVAARCRLDGR